MRNNAGSRAHEARRILAEIAQQLQQVQSAVAVAVAALKQQNCELDLDIANVLQRGAADKIQDQLERMDTLKSVLAHRGSK